MPHSIHTCGDNAVEVRYHRRFEDSHRHKITHSDGRRWMCDVDFDDRIEVKSTDCDGQHPPVQLDMAIQPLRGIASRIALLSPGHQHHYSAGQG